MNNHNSVHLSQRNEDTFHIKTCVYMLIPGLCIIAKTWKQSGWTVTHTVGQPYHKLLLKNKMEQSTDTGATWVNLQRILLREKYKSIRINLFIKHRPPPQWQKQRNREQTSYKKVKGGTDSGDRWWNREFPKSDWKRTTQRILADMGLLCVFPLGWKHKSTHRTNLHGTNYTHECSEYTQMSTSKTGEAWIFWWQGRDYCSAGETEINSAEMEGRGGFMHWGKLSERCCEKLMGRLVKVIWPSLFVTGISSR